MHGVKYSDLGALTNTGVAAVAETDGETWQGRTGQDRTEQNRTGRGGTPVAETEGGTWQDRAGKEMPARGEARDRAWTKEGAQRATKGFIWHTSRSNHRVCGNYSWAMTASASQASRNRPMHAKHKLYIDLIRPSICFVWVKYIDLVSLATLERASRNRPMPITIVHYYVATSGFEMYSAPSTFGAGGPDQTTSPHAQGWDLS